jgi:spore coat protein U-like protein
MSFRRIAVAFTALVAVAAAPAAQAATANTPSPITINATVTSHCTVATDQTTYSLTYDTTAVATTPATVTVKCTKNTPFSLTLGAGNNAAKAAVGARALVGGPLNEYLGYDIVDGSNSPVTTIASQTATGLKTPNTYPLTITIPASQDVAIGAYTDSVTVTVNY